MSGHTVIHIVLNHFTPDYRVLKEVTALQRAGYRVVVFAVWEAGLKERETIDGVAVWRFRLHTKLLPKHLLALPIKLVEWLARMLWAAARMRPAVVHAHDLNGLAAGYVLAQVLRCRLIYDSHELWSHTNSLRMFPGWFVRLARWIERLMVRRADRVITVSESIAHTLETSLNIRRPVVLRNIPETPSAEVHASLREALNIPADAVIFLHIGLLLPHRGIELLLRAFTHIDAPKTYLVFLGAAALPAWIDVPIPPHLAARVRCHPPVPPRQVVAYARGADIGVITISGQIESYRMALPNKLFESIHAGLAVLATDLPELRNLIERTGIGCVFRDGDEADLVRQMRAMLEDRAMLDDMRAAAVRAARTLCWENEQHALLLVYAQLLCR